MTTRARTASKLILNVTPVLSRGLLHDLHARHRREGGSRVKPGMTERSASPLLAVAVEVEDGGFLLFLGSYRVHKNLAALLAAFALALPKLPRDKTLVISGSSDRWSKRFRSSVNQMNAEQERVVFTGYVSNEAVRRLLEGADALVLPSLSEGFGLPVLEAFSADTPVLCSNTTSLPEVGGDAALYFDPRSPASIAETILRFYSDPELAPALAAAGRRRLNQFSWTRAARETIELYRQTLNGSECAAAE